MNELAEALRSRRGDLVGSLLAALAPGLGPSPEAATAALGLAARTSPEGAVRAIARIAPTLARAASPREALENLLRALESFEGDPASIPDRALEHACLLAGLGGAPAASLAAHPEDLPELANAGLVLDDAASFSEDKDAQLDALRRARRRHTLAVAGAELSGRLSTPEAARSLSDAADLILEAALRASRRIAAAKAGEAAASLPFAVLALGKLGGRELNYSSDVDLIFIRGDDAPAFAAEAIGRAFVRALEDTARVGRLYRTDLRLRPEGSTGALVPKASAALAYYERTRRTWERQALVKARAACGDRSLGQSFLRSLASCVWETPLGAKGISEILALRARQEARGAGQDPGSEIDIKEGPGGIRDVEYCVQFLQLLHGGKDASLRTTGTLEAIARLEAAMVIRRSEADALRASYRFLRRTEHTLQLTRDRELKKVPRDPAARTLIARALGLDLAAFDLRLASEQRTARKTLDALVRKPFAEPRSLLAPETRAGANTPAPKAAPSGAVEGGSDAIRDLVLGVESGRAAARELLATIGFRDPDAASRELESLAGERSPYLAPSGRARTLLAGLAPRLLSALARAPDPDSALRNLERATATLGAKATFYELLLENEDALELFVALAAASDFLVETLARRPGVFDEVVDRLLTGERATREAIRAEAASALERAGPDASRAAEALRDVRGIHLLLIGIRDISGRANVQNVARDLAVLAEAMLEALLERARAAVVSRHGGAPRAELAVLALGKLGGLELSYSSDLDLLLVYEASTPAQEGGVTPEAFFEDLARELVRISAGEASAEGPLYPIDLRLRPAGAKGRLAVTLESARRYYSGEGPGEHAADWERLALQKLRPIAGDRAFAERAARALEEELYGRSYGTELREAVVSMRAKQVEAAGEDDLKRSAGGLADVEFLASAIALERGGALTSLREPNTARLLAELKVARLVSAQDHLELLTAYQHLRRVELRLRVAANRPESRIPREPKERRALALRLGYVDAGGGAAEKQLEEELAYHRSRVRAIFERLLRTTGS